MTVFRPNLQEKYFQGDGRPTIDGIRLLQSMYDEITALRDELTTAQAALTAIGAVADPAGGATIDAEARTAISAIIAAAT